MIQKIKKWICCYGYEPAIYDFIKEDVEKSNQNFLYGFGILSFISSVVAFLLDPIKPYMPIYAIFGAASLCMAILHNGKYDGYKMLKKGLFYFLACLLEGAAIYISVYLSVDSKGVIVPPALIFLGILVAGNQVMTFIMMAVVVVTFGMLSYQVKIPYYAFDDMCNGIVYGCAAYFVHCVFARIRIQQILDQNKIVEVSRKYKKLYDTVQCSLFECTISDKLTQMSNRQEIHFFSTNKHFIEMLGYTEEEFEAHICWHMEDLLVEGEKIQRLLQDMQIGDEIRGEVQFRKKDGSVVWTFGNIYRTKGSESDAKYACSCIDIDEGKRAKDANQAKTMFLSNMSHDMRTPLNTIINLASLAHDDITEKRKLRKDLDKIEMAGEFLLGLINDILDMSKIESGKIELHPTVYSFQEFMNYIDGIIAPICSNKDIHFVCKIERNNQVLEQEVAKPSRWGLENEEQTENLWVDKIRFNQIFFNLLSNAVKYTDAGGQVIFEQQNVKSANGMHIADFVITDTGRGMSKEFQRKLFIPFEREHTEEAYTGTGLGLSITKQIVDMMGGEIRISSEENKGTQVCVHLEIPFATQEQAKNHKETLQKLRQATINEIRTEQKNILIVEDHPLNQEIACRILQKKGYMTECVFNGKDAVDKIELGESNHFQAILMDIRMPIMDGINATKKIRELSSEYAKSIPIIAMTANAFEEDVRECLDAGMNAHLAKPITPAKLYETLAMFVDMK